MTEDNDLLGSLGLPEAESDAGSGTDSHLPAPASSAPRTPNAEGYVVLARRYRPQTFSEIVGQDQVQGSLCRAISTGQIGHAYLFSGPRGTGKTSTARILAKALNCMDNGPRPDPCGRCASCTAIASGSSLDVIEIDAASNTGVDNIRDLRSGVVLAPFSKYKVYIVDEVHMLSIQAFNALLKTLEEPPPQVVFVLATTELQKVPETIVSRCQSFQFRRFSSEEIARQLSRILDRELASRSVRIKAEDRSRILDLIAHNADGGMRDAQVALDQVLVLAGEELDFATVSRFLGVAGFDVLERALGLMRGRQTGDLLALVDEVVSSGFDPERFAKSLVQHVRDVLLIKAAPDRQGLINESEERMVAMRKLAGDMSMSFLLSASSTLLALLESMKTASQPRFLLELALIRLSAVDALGDVEEILSRLNRVGDAPGVRGSTAVEGVSSQEARIQAKSRPRASSESAVVAESPATLPSAEATSGSSDLVSEELTPLALFPKPAPQPEVFMAGLRELTAGQKGLLHVSLLEANLLRMDQRTIHLGVSPTNRFSYDHLTRVQNVEALRNAAFELTGRHYEFRVEMVSESQPAPPNLAEPSRPPAGQAREPAPLPTKVADSEMPRVTGPSEDKIRAMMPKRVRKYSGKDLPRVLAGNDAMGELVEQLKKAFRVDDTQLTYRLAE